MSKKKKSIIVSDTLVDFNDLKSEITSSKTKRKFEKCIVEVKRLYDKLFYNAYYDYRFACGNYNKLLEDVRILSSRKGFKLLFVRIPGLTRSFYLKNGIYTKSMALIEDFKNYLSSNREKFVSDTLYVLDNYIVCLPRTKYVKDIYYNFKEKKEKQGNNLGIVYVDYHNYSSKINKNLNFSINEAIRITKEIPSKEKENIKNNLSNEHSEGDKNNAKEKE